MANPEIIDGPPVIAPETLVPHRGAGSSQLDRWVETDPKAALERIKARVEVLVMLRKEAIRCTYPSDWVLNTATDADGQVLRQVGYLQDCGAERASKLWGIEVGAPVIEEKDHADGTFSVHMLAEAWSKTTGERLDYVEGSRWSGDQFFRRRGALGPDEKVDPTDVRKAAYANLHGRAVRALTGLNAVPLETLKDGGIDPAKVVNVAYARGARGGESTGASVGSGAGVGAAADFVLPWGQQKGKKASELADKELAYYMGAYERDIANPDKANFKKNNERGFAALKAERERRDRAAEQGASTPATGAAEPGAEDQPPAGRAGKIAAWHTRMMTLVENQAVRVPAFMRAATTALLGAAKSSPSDLSDAELDTLAAAADEQLQTFVPAKK